MVAQRLDGKACAAKVEQELLTRIAACLDKKTQPHLAVVIVGDDDAPGLALKGLRLKSMAPVAQEDAFTLDR